jgi:pimeloyl-ACP methyl ester carboxylesterase
MLRDEGLDAAWHAYWAPLFAWSADSRVIADARRMMLRHSPSDIARGVTAFHSRPSRGALLPALPCPVVFVTGAEDVAPGPATIAAQAISAPHGRLHVVPDCGHYVPLERPDQLNAILRELIDALG